MKLKKEKTQKTLPQLRHNALRHASTFRCKRMYSGASGGNTLLHLAANLGDRSLCKALMLIDPSLVSVRNSSDATPLQFCLESIFSHSPDNYSHENLEQIVGLLKDMIDATDEPLIREDDDLCLKYIVRSYGCYPTKFETVTIPVIRDLIMEYRTDCLQEMDVKKKVMNTDFKFFKANKAKIRVAHQDLKELMVLLEKRSALDTSSVFGVSDLMKVFVQECQRLRSVIVNVVRNQRSLVQLSYEKLCEDDSFDKSSLPSDIQDLADGFLYI